MLPMIDARTVARLVPMADAIAGLERALADGLDPAADPARSATGLADGHVLLMPSGTGDYAGVKLATVAPDNPAAGLPRIQGVYVLFSGGTLTPLAVLDGIALTSLRTPAVSAVAVRHSTPDRPLRVVVFGTGPQAYAHVTAVLAVRPVAELTVVPRGSATHPDPRVDRFAALLPAGTPVRMSGPDAVRDADLVVCCTSAREPVFDGALLGERAAVVAMGSHEPAAREVDATVVARSRLYVEDAEAALREAGDLIMAGVSDPDRLTGLARLCREPVDLDRPRLFKSVGMSWEDLVVAGTAYERFEVT